jgi:hypothetical protein
MEVMLMCRVWREKNKLIHNFTKVDEENYCMVLMCAHLKGNFTSLIIFL